MNVVRLVLVSALTACGAPVARPTAAACEGPLEIELPRADRCEDLELFPDGRTVRLVVDDREEIIAAPEALAWREPSGVGWVSVDHQRRVRLRPPGHPPVEVGLIPDDARQWGLSEIITSVDGWWVIGWASWVHPHFERRPGRTIVARVSRTTLASTLTCPREAPRALTHVCVARSDTEGRCFGRC